MGTCSPNLTRRHTALAFVVAALVPATSLAEPARGASSPPAKLVGSWTRTITAADVRRSGAQTLLEGAVCTVTIKPTTFKKGPYRGWMPARSACVNGAGTHVGWIVPAGANRIHINLGYASQSTYTWRVSGRRLTFDVRDDESADRRAAFVGTW